jgi:hypothetical protein
MHIHYGGAVKLNMIGHLLKQKLNIVDHIACQRMNCSIGMNNLCCILFNNVFKITESLLRCLC